MIILLLIFFLPFFWNSYFSIVFFITLITLNSIILYFLGIYFMSLSLILIYSGAIPILIIFIIKLVSISRLNKFKLKFIYLKIFFFFKIFFIISFLVNDFIFFSENLNLLYFLCSNDSNFLLNFFNVNLYYKPGLNSVDLLFIKDFFYSIFFLYFIVSTLLLLVSMVGSISVILLFKKN